MKDSFIKRGLFPMLLSLLIQPSVFATYEQITPECSIETYSDRYLVYFELPEYEESDYYDSICENYASVIDMDADCDYTDLPGYPQLPFFSINLSLPNNTTHLQLTKTMLRTDTITPKYILAPAPIDSLALEEKEIWSIKDSCYRQHYYSWGKDANFPNGFHQGYATISNIYSRLGVSGVTLSIYPFSYHPDSGYVSVLKKGWFVISDEQKNDFLIARKNLEDAKDIKTSIMKLFFDNHHRHDSCIYDVTNDSRGDFLIVAAERSMASHLAKFIKHKNSLNYNTKAIYLDELKCQGNSSMIKYYINNNDSLPNPDYVLLVGTLEDIPAYSGTADHHNPYSDDGYHPFIGRWILEKAEYLYKIDSIADRTIISERNYKDYDFSVESFSGVDRKHKSVSKTFYKSISTYKSKYTDALGISNTLHDGRDIDSTKSHDSIKAALQKHPRIFLYRGHGGLHSFYNSPYMELPYKFFAFSWLDNITSPYCIGIGLACELNSYYYETNVGTNLLTNHHPACVNYYSATTLSNRTANNVLGKRIFSQLNTLYDQLDNFPTSVWFKLAEWEYYYACKSNVRNWEVLKYNLMGDPTLLVGALKAEQKQKISAPYSQERVGESEVIRYEIFDSIGNLIDSGSGNADLFFGKIKTIGVYIVREIRQDGTINTYKILLK